MSDLPELDVSLDKSGVKLQKGLVLIHFYGLV